MNTIQILGQCVAKLATLQKMFPIAQYQDRVNEIDQQTSDCQSWSNPLSVVSLMKERSKLDNIISIMSDFDDQVSYYQELASIFPEEVEREGTNIFILHSKISDLEFKQMMHDPIDDSPAILTISAGAGGLEAANWVTMLLRMYIRYTDSQGFKVEFLNQKNSEEHSAICMDSVSIRIEGPYAYGFLKGESGVHRLIRNSPFNAADARQTSFAAVSVTADIEDIIDIKIEEKDIEITAQTSSGPGGQNVNRIKSAIRLKHLPTGINILVRTERDQLSNKKTAFKMLKAKLYEIEIKKRELEKNKNIENIQNVSFGSQIRTYTMTPYSLCKDHRTGYETNNVQSILDGNIQDFLFSYLKFNINS